MPNTIAQFDDELQTLAGTAADATDLTAGGRRLLNRATDQVTATKATVSGEEATGRRRPAAGDRAGRGSARRPRRPHPCGAGTCARDRCGACATRFGRQRP
jgi:hypothetical protein